jgi:hypothetical protein
MDLYYIDEDYYNPSLGYFVYTANAEALLADYIDLGYIDPYYYLGQGAGATLTADLTEVVGVTVEASGSFTSQCSLSVDIVRTRTAASAMSAVATVTAQGFRTQEIVLTAFSDAATTTNGVVIRSADTAMSLAATQSTTVLRIRDTAVTLSSSFTVTASVSLAVIAEATLASASTFTVDAEANRSADITLTSIVTQSLTAVRGRDVTANIAGTFTQSATASNVIDSSAALSSQASSTAVITITKEFDVALTSAFSPIMTVSAVRNSFAVLDSVSTVTVAAVVDRNATEIGRAHV